MYSPHGMASWLPSASAYPPRPVTVPANVEDCVCVLASVAGVVSKRYPPRARPAMAAMMTMIRIVLVKTLRSLTMTPTTTCLHYIKALHVLFPLVQLHDAV